MTKGIRLTRDSFFILYDRIREIHREDYEERLENEEYKKNGYELPTGESAPYFGFGHTPNRKLWDLYTSMKKNEEVKTYLEDHDYDLNAKKLYSILLGFKRSIRSTDTVLLKEQYEKVYFLYAGFDDVYDFIEKRLDDKDEAKTKSYQKALLTLGEKEFSGYETKYKGYYYSFRHHKVKEFDLKIDYINNFIVEEKGLHANEREPYTGTAKHHNHHLIMNLSNTKGGVLNFLAFIGSQYTENIKIILATYQTISSISGHPVSRETVLIKEDLINDKSRLDITRYLMTQQRNHRIRPQIYDKTSRLTPKGYPLNYLNHMIGDYVVWTLNRKKSIIQARWILEEDHSSYLFSDVAIGRQVCIFRKSDVGGRSTLCVTSVAAQGVGILNFALIDLPNQASGPVDYLNGVFVTKGIRGSVAKYAVFMKLDQERVEKGYKPTIGIISEEELEILLQENRYRELKNRLFELTSKQQIPFDPAVSSSMINE